MSRATPMLMFDQARCELLRNVDIIGCTTTGECDITSSMAVTDMFKGAANLTDLLRVCIRLYRFDHSHWLTSILGDWSKGVTRRGSRTSVGGSCTRGSCAVHPAHNPYRRSPAAKADSEQLWYETTVVSSEMASDQVCEHSALRREQARQDAV